MSLPLLKLVVTMVAVVGLWPAPAGLVRAPLRARELLARAAIAGAIVVAVTGLAALVGPQWAGLLAGFPVVSFPLFVILHLGHGPGPVTAVVRHYPFGIVALVVFTLVARWGFGALGLTGGTLAGLGAALVWLAVAQGMQMRLPLGGARQAASSFKQAGSCAGDVNEGREG